MQKKLTSYVFRRHPEEPFGHDEEGFNEIRLGHVALHNSPNANAGDTLLPQAVRAAFDKIHGSFGWHYYHLWDRFTPKAVEKINATLDGLVVGGGGFIIKDQWGSDIRRSGWSWNISREDIAAIKVPYCLFAVGYNRFRNQEDFDEAFVEHINLTVRNAMFVGLRNTGSIRAVARYLKDQELREKLKLQFCPTTCSYQLWPDKAAAADRFEREFSKRSKPTLALNFAGDRLDMRTDNNVEAFMRAFAEFAHKAVTAGWDVVLTTHKEMDRQIEPYLDQRGVDYMTHDLTFASAMEILDFYATIDLSVGMRGHSQLIPLGLRKPIVSVISHDKMGYLLEDIGYPEWGVDVKSADWVDRLAVLIDQVGLKDRVQTLASLAAAQQSCWTCTTRNVATIVAGLRAGKN